MGQIDDIPKIKNHYKLNLSDNDVNGLEFEIFGKNVTDEEVITGRYLTDDSSGLYSNIFLSEPRLYGVRVRKSW